jgi:hypothetical protein
MFNHTYYKYPSNFTVKSINIEEAESTINKINQIIDVEFGFYDELSHVSLKYEEGQTFLNIPSFIYYLPESLYQRYFEVLRSNGFIHNIE